MAERAPNRVLAALAAIRGSAAALAALALAIMLAPRVIPMANSFPLADGVDRPAAARSSFAKAAL